MQYSFTMKKDTLQNTTEKQSVRIRRDDQEEEDLRSKTKRYRSKDEDVFWFGYGATKIKTSIINAQMNKYSLCS